MSIEDLKAKIRLNPTNFLFTDNELVLVLEDKLSGTFADSTGATSSSGGLLAGTGGSGAAALPQQVSYLSSFDKVFEQHIRTKSFSSLSYNELRYASKIFDENSDEFKKVVENIETADLLELLDGFTFDDFDVEVSVLVNEKFKSGGSVALTKLPTFEFARDTDSGNNTAWYSTKGGFAATHPEVVLRADTYNDLVYQYEIQNGSNLTLQDQVVYIDESVQINGNLKDSTEDFSYTENRPQSGFLKIITDNFIDFKNPAGILRTFYKNFLLTMITASDAKTTIQSNFEATVEVAATDIVFYLSYDFEANRRYNLVEAARQLGYDASAEDILDAAEALALADLADSGLLSEGGITQDNTPLDPEDIEKFYEQCVLLASMKDLKRQFTDIIKESAPDESNPPSDSTSKGVHDGFPYQERFYMVQTPSGSNDKIVNFLNAPRGKLADSFLNITPDIQAFLTPKIRLYKVFNDGNSLKQIEFIFKNSTDSTNLLNELFKDNDKFFRGSGYGIKDFSFSFNGTTPATAKNDITANLTLFFQDFSDFVTPITTSQGTFKFVDLIFYDKRDDSVPTYGYGSTHPDQYSPAYYRIRADVGWRVPENHPQFDDACRKRNIDPELVREAIRKTNKSYYLNMVEHDLNFKADGTVEIKAQYRGYIESLLKGTEMDALVDQSIIDDRKRRAQSLITALKICSPGETARIKRIYAAEEQKLREKLYQNTFNRLNELGRVRTMQVKSDGGFRVDGYFAKPPEINDITDDKTTPQGADTFSYYFLGDLLYVMLDVLYANRDDEDFKSAPIQKTKFILPTIEFENFFEDTGIFSINLAQIPVSDRYFQEWFTEHVIKAKRQVYPIMFYLRDLLNNLIADALIDVCLNRNYRKSFNFQTTTVNASDDPLAGHSSLKNPIITLNQKDLPFTVKEGGDLNDITNYVLVYAAYSTILPSGRGQYDTDIKNGVYHFHLGQDRGIINNVKFSKVDMAYIREARYMREGVDGLLQLGAVYRASLTMFGNTLFYPGMLIYINPFGIGGEDFLPNKPTSTANKLGLGGYHLIEKVNSSISSGLFKTTVDAMFVYSGDGDTRFNIQGKQKEKPEENLEVAPPTQQTCPGFTRAVENDARELLTEGTAGNRAAALAEDIERRLAGSPLISPTYSSGAVTDVDGADGDGIPDAVDATPNGETQ